MKKKYSKPLMNIELFTLAQSIAATCPALQHDTGLGNPNHYSKTSCGWNMGNIIIFTAENSGCTVKWEEDDPVNIGDIALCYNNPDGGTQIFGS